MDKESTAPLMPHLRVADNCLTPCGGCSSVVSPSEVSGEQAAKAVASASLSANVARKRCDDLAEYLGERRAQAENLRLASMHAREEVQRAQKAQLARRDNSIPFVLVEQVPWDAKVLEDHAILSYSGHSFDELDLSRRFDPRKPDMGEAFHCIAPSCSCPTWNGKIGEVCCLDCGVNSATCHTVACDQDFYEAESNVSTTDGENSMELCSEMDQYSDAGTSGSSPGSPSTSNRGSSFGPLLVGMGVPPLEGERSSLGVLSAQEFSTRPQSSQGLTKVIVIV